MLDVREAVNRVRRQAAFLHARAEQRDIFVGTRHDSAQPAQLDLFERRRGQEIRGAGGVETAFGVVPKLCQHTILMIEWSVVSQLRQVLQKRKTGSPPGSLNTVADLVAPYCVGWSKRVVPIFPGDLPPSILLSMARPLILMQHLIQCVRRQHPFGPVQQGLGIGALDRLAGLRGEFAKAAG